MDLLHKIVEQWRQEHPEENEESDRMMEIFSRIIGDEASECSLKAMLAVAMDDDGDLYSALYALFMVGASKYRDLMIAAGVDVVEIELNLLHNMQE